MQGGTFKSTPGFWFSECEACEECPAGMERRGCGGAFEGKCVECEEGTFEKDGACVKCEGCAAGLERKECGEPPQGSARLVPKIHSP